MVGLGDYEEIKGGEGRKDRCKLSLTINNTTKLSLTQQILNYVAELTTTMKLEDPLGEQPKIFEEPIGKEE